MPLRIFSPFTYTLVAALEEDEPRDSSARDMATKDASEDHDAQLAALGYQSELKRNFSSL